MEDYEILRKYFIDKEKENIKLKEELDLLKSKMNLSSDIKLNKSQIIETRNITEIPPRMQSDTNFNSSAMMENLENKNEEFTMDKSNYAYLSKSMAINKGKEKNTKVLLNNGTIRDELNLNLNNSQSKSNNELRETLPGLSNLRSSEFLKFPGSNQSMNENIPTPILKSLNSSKVNIKIQLSKFT